MARTTQGNSMSRDAIKTNLPADRRRSRCRLVRRGPADQVRNCKVDETRRRCTESRAADVTRTLSIAESGGEAPGSASTIRSHAKTIPDRRAIAASRSRLSTDLEGIKLNARRRTAGLIAES